MQQSHSCREMKSICLRDNCTPMPIAAPLTIDKKWGNNLSVHALAKKVEKEKNVGYGSGWPQGMGE